MATGETTRSARATTKACRQSGRGPAGFVLAAAVLAFAGNVQAAAPAGRYTINTDTVFDTKTGLTWQRAVPSQSYTWADAKAYCQSLSLAGLAKWRLPTRKELQSIVDVSVYYPSIDPVAFPSTPMVEFWSSSAYAIGTGGTAWYVAFSHGFTGAYSTSNSYQVRCVR